MTAKQIRFQDLPALVGQEIGVSDWYLVTQHAVDAYAAATDDHQWICEDVERAKRESPFGGTVAPDPNEAWIFGYGSLIWNPGFSFTDRRIGYIRGWARRFYQGSTDHRGVPGSPGRVVTLVADGTSTCWGVAYQVASSSADSVFAYLDYREKGGFRRHLVDFYADTSDDQHPVRNVCMYVAESENPNYLGPAPLPDIAQQIFQAKGPSGPNSEYLIQLAEGLRAIGVSDEHVFSLEQHVRWLGTQL